MLRKGKYPNMAVCQFIAPVHWYQVIAMKMQPASNDFFLACFFLGIYTLFVAGYSYENALVSYKSNPQLGIIGDLSQIHHDYGW